MAASERDLLANKASGVREAIEEAEQALQALLEGGQDKVGRFEGRKRNVADLCSRLSSGQDLPRVEDREEGA